MLPILPYEKLGHSKKKLIAAARTERLQNRNSNAVVEETTSNVELEPSTEKAICPDIQETQLSAAEALLELHNSMLLTTYPEHEIITHADKACQANEFHMKCQEKPTLMEMIKSDSDLNSFTAHADIVKNKNDCYNFDEEEESCQTDRTDKETKAANHSISSDNMAIPNFNFNNWEWEVNDRNVTKGSDYRRSKNFDLFNLEVENSKKVVKEGNGFINENQEIQVDFEEMQDSAMEPTENEIYNVNGLQKKIEILSTKLLDDNLKNKTKIVELAKKNRDGYTNNGFTNSEVGRNEVENEINFDNIYEKVGTSCEQRIQENEEVRDRSNSMDCEIEIDNLANNSFEDSSYCPETSNDSSSNSKLFLIVQILYEYLHSKSIHKTLLKKTFKSPSLAMHLGTSLKLVCEELVHLILKEKIGFRSSSVKHKKDWLENINYFKQLIKNRWNIELSSIANKDLNEKRWKKPLIVPLVSDVKKFRDQTLKLAQDYGRQIVQNEDNIKIFKLFVQSTLALLIIFNRRRIGDIQYLKIKDYLDEHKTNFKDFESVLTEGEKQLTRKYKRVLNSGKGSRAVVILIPEIIQSFINIIITYRNKYISTDNDYLFALPGSSIKWGKGDVALRTFSKMCNLENPQSITSNKLRKQIATVAQILNLSKEETKQFSKFMGHTEKTHEEFYELPVDIYQTAKVSKLLLMLEKGMPTKYKGKSLAEIDVDINQEYAEEEEEEEEEEGKVEDEKKNEDNGNNDDEDRLVNVPKTITKKTLKKRKGWSKDNLSLLNKEFSKHIKNRTYPSTIEIRNFIKEYKINRTEAVVRSKIQHLLKQKFGDSAPLQLMVVGGIALIDDCSRMDGWTVVVITYNCKARVSEMRSSRRDPYQLWTETRKEF
ncbi:hypothetical protein RN001_005640 [Aquatica leii]|uniref:Uncharacterized protein n=1 Tax=Aquatica leii TaxID=1421715 RepID=A0AAN7PK61_9COLE|nr:hypothetical protein RN001_005640 [Aquatica leii]